FVLEISPTIVECPRERNHHLWLFRYFDRPKVSLHEPLALNHSFAQSDRIMKQIIAILACAAGLCGCAGTGPVPHLSDHRAQKLVTQAEQLAVVGGPLPSEFARLNPVQVYGDHGNIVIALQRDASGEQGFYIVPTISSYDPRYKAGSDWTFTLVNQTD